jgi:L-lactate dehydrogenase (FMN-dependent) and related alpha-hydroxy acid dehydrogenases
MNLKKQRILLQDEDPTATSRKRDHIELAFQSQIETNSLDSRFYYEPLLSAHPRDSELSISFLGKKLTNPIWVSSMTGGTELARTINHNLARACKEFGMGMGLGSCRGLLNSDEYRKDFDVRSIMGDELPLFVNLGVAQVEQLLLKNQVEQIFQMMDKLQADGLIIHVNPLQEWLQPEGDRFKQAPLKTIEEYLKVTDRPVIVKEVGQGMGYESLKALFQLPLAAVDFAASGGTNFAKLELLRSNPEKQTIYESLAKVGHSAEEMVKIVNKLKVELGEKMVCKEVIISGGVKNFLDGYYLINKLNLSCVYGQASGFLKHARGDYRNLYNYVKSQVDGLALAKAFLKVKMSEI